MEKQDLGELDDGSRNRGMDYKTAILKGITEIQASTNDSKINAHWEQLKAQAKKETAPWKLHWMYQCLIEQMAVARGEPAPGFDIKTEDGVVRHFDSVKDYLEP
jgi:hypothetical protein